VTRRVSTDWELERCDDFSYHNWTLVLKGELAYAPATFDDPGESRLELDSVTCGGEPFALTADEERRIVDAWLEDLRREE
jgi:hypothetical protein